MWSLSKIKNLFAYAENMTKENAGYMKYSPSWEANILPDSNLIFHETLRFMSVFTRTFRMATIWARKFKFTSAHILIVCV
jgi:hypothetical protein